MTRASAAVLAVVLAACGPLAPPVLPQHVEWAQARWPNTTAMDLERGRSLYIAKCSGCHRPPKPSDYSPASWPAELAHMRKRAHLGPREQTWIEYYVVALASSE